MDKRGWKILWIITVIGLLLFFAAAWFRLGQLRACETDRDIAIEALQECRVELERR